ncbi:MAG: NAD-dependent epimerase/dehydratase family protein [Deltaproteobacteria bacterium]|nr:MAG: NAD-dependent epimerase/dehydratase family protein [Deltaproteobacteria bacterium]
MALPSPIFIVGLGYTGRRLALSLAGSGLPVMGTARTPGGAPELTGAGVAVITGCLEEAERLAARVPPGARIVYTAPPVGPPGPTDAGARAFFATVREAAHTHLVYLSSTGVYAESGGGAVDESAPVRTGDLRAARRLDAEQAVLETASALGATGIVFRCAGIYGPGRTLARRLREGRLKLWGGGHNYVCRIHVDDLVRFLRAALEAAPACSGIYNLADDRATPLRTHALDLARRLGLPPPPEAPLSDAPSPTLTGSKRVVNTRAKRTFGLDLLYPSYDAAYDALGVD